MVIVPVGGGSRSSGAGRPVRRARCGQGEGGDGARNVVVGQNQRRGDGGARVKDYKMLFTAKDRWLGPERALNHQASVQLVAGSRRAARHA